jgi:hypothetical protein
MPPPSKKKTEKPQAHVPNVKIRPRTETVSYGITGYNILNDLNPIVNLFVKPADRNKYTLKEPYTIVNYDLSASLLYIAEKAEPIPVYMKAVHLLDPHYYMKTREGYIGNNMSQSLWSFGHGSLLDQTNKAYTESLAFHLTSQLGDVVPHYIKWYGCVRAVAESYIYDIEDDFEEYRFTRWFWKNYDEGWFDLQIVDEKTGAILSREEIIKEFKPDDDILTDTEGSESEGESEDEDLSSISAEEIDELNPNEDENTMMDLESVSTIKTAEVREAAIIGGIEGHSQKPYSDGSYSENSYSNRYKLNAVLPKMPVMINFLEKIEGGTLYDLLEDEKGEPVDERKWFAYLFQICSAMAILQETLQLTHNDLHTNNVLWKTTADEYVYYKSASSGKKWRVPTYGKIFYIIDFGRSIFMVNHKTSIISSDFKENNDADGQYNFGSIYNDKLPKRMPNKSFDLCLLASSLLRSLYPMNPEEKGAGAQIMTTEQIDEGKHSWIVRETVSPLFNMLWKWLASKEKIFMVENYDTFERWERFDLYIGLAEYAWAAVPGEQYRNDWTRQFEMVNSAATVPGFIQLP